MQHLCTEDVASRKESRLRRSRERRKLFQQGSGGAPVENDVSAVSKSQIMHFCCHCGATYHVVYYLYRTIDKMAAEADSDGHQPVPLWRFAIYCGASYKS